MSIRKRAIQSKFGLPIAVGLIAVAAAGFFLKVEKLDGA
jgi:hypothetical protein